MELSRRERNVRLNVLKTQIRSAKKDGSITRREAIQIRAAMLFNPRAVEGFLDVLAEDAIEEHGALARLENGDVDWVKFFDTLLSFIEKLMPLIMGLCP